MSRYNYDQIGHDVRVATADAGLEMKLVDRGIRVIFLDPSSRLTPKSDPEKQRANKLQTELTAIHGRMPNLALDWEQPVVVMRQTGFGEVDDYVKDGLDRAERAYQASQCSRTNYPTDSIWNPRYDTDLMIQAAFLS